MVLMTRLEKSIQEIATAHVNVGVEVEKLRVDQQNKLSLKSFPQNLSQDIAEYIEREFLTAQLEVVFPPAVVAEDNVALITEVMTELDQQLRPGERLWPFSCPPELPPHISESEISAKPDASLWYRKRIGQLYDVRRVANTGVHLNLSFSADVVDQLVNSTSFTDSNELYIHLAQQFMLHHWLFTYLFGATPTVDASYFDGPGLQQPVRSIRNSPYGFPTSIIGDYSSAANYVTRIEWAVTTGELMQPGQYYEGVRLKGQKGKALRSILTDGISHLELRFFDLNPFKIAGLTSMQIRLIQLLALYFVQQEPIPDSKLVQKLSRARRKNIEVALENPIEECRYQQQGLELLAALREFALTNQLDEKFVIAVEHFKECFVDCEQTLSVQVLDMMSSVTT